MDKSNLPHIWKLMEIQIKKIISIELKQHNTNANCLKIARISNLTEKKWRKKEVLFLDLGTISEWAGPCILPS